jgi:hypothetical protein
MYKKAEDPLGSLRFLLFKIRTSALQVEPRDGCVQSPGQILAQHPDPAVRIWLASPTASASRTLMPPPGSRSMKLFNEGHVISGIRVGFKVLAVTVRRRGSSNSTMPKQEFSRMVINGFSTSS